MEEPGDDHPGPAEHEQEARQAPRQGVLQRLQDEDWQHAKRTVMRLHRNLGH